MAFPALTVISTGSHIVKRLLVNQITLSVPSLTYLSIFTISSIDIEHTISYIHCTATLYPIYEVGVSPPLKKVGTPSSIQPYNITLYHIYSLYTSYRLACSGVHVDAYGFKHQYGNEGMLLHYLCQQLHSFYLTQASSYKQHQQQWREALSKAKTALVLTVS